ARGLWLMAAGGAALIVAHWAWAPVASWAGLLSALVGLAGGGLLVWLVRIIGSAALGREAMGFGDVTLMAMIGTFVGWQGCLLVFFLAPLAGLVIAVGQWGINRGHEIPFGPFLCLATVATIVAWQPIWRHIEPVFYF